MELSEGLLPENESGNVFRSLGKRPPTPCQPLYRKLHADTSPEKQGNTAEHKHDDFYADTRSSTQFTPQGAGK